MYMISGKTSGTEALRLLAQVRMYLCVYMYVLCITRIYVCMRICVYMYMQMCYVFYVCMYAHTRVCVCECVCVYVCVWLYGSHAAQVWEG